MTTNSKLTQVLEYLVKNDEAKAREILHQVFIEKARAIHEEIMGMDDEHEEAGMEDHVGQSGDQGEDLTHDIRAMENEIDFEQTMSEGGDDDQEDHDMDDMDDMGVDMPQDDDTDLQDETVPTKPVTVEPEEVSTMNSSMADLQASLDALRATFKGLEDETETEDHTETSVDADNEEVPTDESWEFDEEFDDLAESLDLEIVTRDMEKSAKTPDEVGSGKSGMSNGSDAKSPLPKSQTSRMGAKPVETGKGGAHSGYSMETAPKSEKMADMKDDNRRKKATDGTSKVSKEGNSNALLNKTKSEFGADTVGKMSVLSKGSDNLK